MLVVISYLYWQDRKLLFLFDCVKMYTYYILTYLNVRNTTTRTFSFY